MCQSTFKFWSIVTITLDTRFNEINVENLQGKIEKELNGKLSGLHSVTKEKIAGFDVKLFKATNDGKNTDGAQHDTATVTVFIQFTTAGQGKDHIQIPSTIYDLYTIYDSRYVPIYAITIPNNSAQNRTKMALYA